MSSGHDVNDMARDVYRQMWEGIDQGWDFEDIDDLDNVDDWCVAYRNISQESNQRSDSSSFQRWSNVGEHDASATTTTTNERSTPPPPLRSHIDPPPPRLCDEHLYAAQPHISRSRELRQSSPRLMGTGPSRLSPQATSSPHATTSQRRRASTARAGRSRIPEYSENWLDRNTTGHDDPSDYLFDPLWLRSIQPTASNSRSDNEDGVDIDDILDYSAALENTMPYPGRFGRRREEERDAVVDLTSLPSSPGASTTHQPISLKRSAESSTQHDRSKRRRTDPTSNGPFTPIEELDLTNEAPTAEEELAQTQQAQLLQAQQPSTASSGPLKIGQRTCIICMEPFTNATTTSCGHMYCHECLTQALIAGEKASEKGVGNCPVCRKPVKRNGKGNQIIPIAFMKKSAFKGKGRRDLTVLG